MNRRNLLTTLRKRGRVKYRNDGYAWWNLWRPLHMPPHRENPPRLELKTTDEPPAVSPQNYPLSWM